MVGELTWFLGSALAVIGGGVVLSRTADCISERTGFGGLAVGSILLAAVTTLPEIVTDVSAVRMGALDLGVGDILGSCLFNLFILALIDLVHDRRHRVGVLRRVVAGHAKAATLSIVLLGTAAVFLLLRIPTAVFGIGIGTLLLGAIYLFGMRAVLREEAKRTEETEPTVETGMSLRAAAIGFLLAASAVVLAGPRLAHSAEAIARASGFGSSFFGTTFLALVTSLPELVASVTALRIGARDLAVGNLFGSNAFNVAVLLIFDAAYREGALLAAVRSSHVVTALFAVALTAMALRSLRAGHDRRLWWAGPDALAMMAVFTAGLGVLYVLR
jgi:cation:H+ antiporter